MKTVYNRHGALARHMHSRFVSSESIIIYFWRAFIPVSLSPSINGRMFCPDDISYKKVSYLSRAPFHATDRSERPMKGIISFFRMVERLSQNDMKYYITVIRTCTWYGSHALCRTFFCLSVAVCLNGVEIMWHCRSYFRCSIRCGVCVCSDLAIRLSLDIQAMARERRKAPSGLVNKLHKYRIKTGLHIERILKFGKFQIRIWLHIFKSNGTNSEGGGIEDERCYINGNWITIFFPFDRCFQMLLTLHWLR